MSSGQRNHRFTWGMRARAFTNTFPPSAWTAEQRAVAFGLPTAYLCRQYSSGSYVPDYITRTRYSVEDYEIIGQVLRQRGMTSRDLEIIRQDDADFGTGQSYQGLICSIGNFRAVNKSFIAGRHSWQVVTFTNNYIYLEGNGTPETMRVTGWN